MEAVEEAAKAALKSQAVDFSSVRQDCRGVAEHSSATVSFLKSAT
jgi:hypothetical protein